MIKNAHCVITGHSSVAEESMSLGTVAMTYHSTNVPNETVSKALVNNKTLGIFDYSNKKELHKAIMGVRKKVSVIKTEEKGEGDILQHLGITHD